MALTARAIPVVSRTRVSETPTGYNNNYGNNGANQQMQAPQNEIQYVDSAGQVRQVNPNNPNQNNLNRYNPNNPTNPNPNLLAPQQPDPITDFQRLVQQSLGQQIQIFGRQLFPRRSVHIRTAGSDPRDPGLRRRPGR